MKYIEELNQYLIEKNLLILKSNYFNFKINDDRINDFSIRYDPNNIENCAQGMKYLLVILKSYIDSALKIEDDLYKDIINKSNVVNIK